MERPARIVDIYLYHRNEGGVVFCFPNLKFNFPCILNFIKKSMNYNFIWAIEVRGKLRPGVVCVVLLYMSHKFFSPVGNKFCPILKDMSNA